MRTAFWNRIRDIARQYRRTGPSDPLDPEIDGKEDSPLGLAIGHETLERYEARRLVKVKHPNVVRAFGAERAGDEVGLSMELVKGQTLEEIVRRRAPFSATEETLIGIDLSGALAAVHAAGILHGDIKAHNVMREEGGRAVLMDFGTGRDLKRQPPGAGERVAVYPSSSGSTSHRCTGCRRGRCASRASWQTFTSARSRASSGCSGSTRATATMSSDAELAGLTVA